MQLSQHWIVLHGIWRGCDLSLSRMLDLGRGLVNISQRYFIACLLTGLGIIQYRYVLPVLE